MTTGKPAAPKKKTTTTAASAPAKRPVARKTAGDAKSAAKAQPSAEAAVVTVHERHAMVAQAAYFRAKERGFAAGRELDDWVAAESEVDEKLAKRRPE